MFDNDGGIVTSAEWRNTFSLGLGFPAGVDSNDQFIHRAGFFAPAYILRQVDGHVIYCDSCTNTPAIRVPEVIITLVASDGDTQQDTTNSNGEFHFTKEIVLPAYLVATKTAGYDTNKTITISDEIRARRYLANLDTVMTPEELIASNVDIDTSITEQDADHIHDLAFGRSKKSGSYTGEWRVLTDDLKNCTLVLEPGNAQDTLTFIAILLGDNTGSYKPAILLSKTNETERVGPLVNLHVVTGDTFAVPIPFPQSVSYKFAAIQLKYDDTVLKYLSKHLNTDGEDVQSPEQLDQGLLKINLAAGRLHSAKSDTLFFKFYTGPDATGTTEIECREFRFDDRGYPLPKFKIYITESTKLPKHFALYQNYPNPFNPSTIIRFDVPPPGGNHAKLVVFDLQGRKVRTLRDEPLKPGRYALEWDGRNDAGQRLASGLYIYRFETAGFVRSRKMILLK
jgi:hypothetical protein